MPSSFWQFYFTDSPWRRRQDIDRAIESEALDVGMLQMRMNELSRELHEAQLTLAALMKVMSEMGQLDPRAVQTRVEAELEAMRPPPPAPPAPSAPAPVKQPPPSFDVRCDRCGNTVPSTRTTITASGTLCDSCAGV
jgi:hypothetical protein